MGQQVQAIVYGVYQEDNHAKLFGENGDFVVEPPINIERGDGKRPIIGIAVAVQNVFDESKGEVDFPECCLEDVDLYLDKQYRKTKKKWNILEEWATKQKVYLGYPELMLVPIERA